MLPGREPSSRPGLPDAGGLGDNLIVPERPELPEINVPPQPPGFPVGSVQSSLERIEKKLDDIDRRLREIETKL